MAEVSAFKVIAGGWKMSDLNSPVIITVPSLRYSTDTVPFIAVHVGAGRHATKRAPEYKQLCKAACLAGINALNLGQSATTAATLALSVLEDSELTNAGKGSCLNEEGRVECEAALMEARGPKWAAVGALENIANPIQAAEQLLTLQQETESRLLSRMPPCLLVGQGAYHFAVKRGVKTAANGLVTSKARALYESYSRRLAQAKALKRQRDEEESVTDDGPSSAKRIASEIENDGCHSLDTVGVIVMDKTGHVVTGASSGGIALKLPGRLGQVCHYGAGCWAQEGSDRCTGVVTTGCGEQLIRTCLAKEVATALLDATDDTFSLQETIVKRFMNAPELTEDVAKGHGLVGGGLGFVYFKEERGYELHLWHSTASLALGYMTGSSPKPKFVLSRMDPNIEGKSFQLQMVSQSMENPPRP